MTKDKTLVQLRYELAAERLAQIPLEEAVAEPFRPFFARAAAWLLLLDSESRFLERLREGKEQKGALVQHNHALYAEILPGAYEHSFANPAYACRVLGKEYGPLAAALFYELRGCIPFVYRGETERLLIRMELLLEIYSAFSMSYREEGTAPPYKEVREIISLYLCDYAQEEEIRRLQGLCDPEAARTVVSGKEGTGGDICGLYCRGEFVSNREGAYEEDRAGTACTGENGRKQAALALRRWHAKMEESGISWEDYTYVRITAASGFCGAASAAAAALGEEGMKAILPLEERTLFVPPGAGVCGIRGDDPNPQYTADHREDLALFMDPLFLNRKLEGIREAREAVRGLLRGCAPAALELGTEEGGQPGKREPLPAGEAPSLSARQRRMAAELAEAAAAARKEFPV